MLALRRPQLPSFSLHRIDAIFSRRTSEQKTARTRTKDDLPATLVPSNLLEGRVLVCVGLSLFEIAQVESYAVALSGTVVVFNSVLDGLNFVRQTALDPILMCSLDSDDVTPQDMAELRSKVPSVALIALSERHASNRFGAFKPEPTDAALRAPLTRTVFQLGLQAALATVSVRETSMTSSPLAV